MYVKNGFRLNILALVAMGLLFVSTFLPWWGLDIGTFYSFRWTMWSGPLVMFGNTDYLSWINNVNQFLSSGTSIIGTLALGTAFLTLLGAEPKRTRLLGAGIFCSVVIVFLYLVVVAASVGTVRFSPFSDVCIRGVSGTCDAGMPGSSLIETWGFQTGYFLYIAGIVVASCAFAVDRIVTRRAIDVAESKRETASVNYS